MVEELPVPVPYFSNEMVPFTVVVEANGSTYPPDVVEAVERFLSLRVEDRQAASARVFTNYKDYADAVEIDLEIDHPAAVWNHVRVTDIIVDRRHHRDQDVYIVATCECEWEIEHGLQLVFRRGSNLVRVSDQDGHLTDSDAYDQPDDDDA